MYTIPDVNTANVLQCIEQASGDVLETIAWALVSRYTELYPAYEVGLLSLPKNDPEGRKRCIEAMLEHFEKAKMDSLG